MHTEFKIAITLVFAIIFWIQFVDDDKHEWMEVVGGAMVLGCAFSFVLGVLRWVWGW
jgi:hypothetical protein